MTVAQLIEELKKYPLHWNVYVDLIRQGSEETGAWAEDADPVIYDMDTHLRISS